MSLAEVVYVFAISFQLSGAVLLIFQFWGIRIKKGIEENKRNETHVENETLFIGKTQPTPFEYTKNIWLNRFAFILIAIGYLLGVFGSIENYSKWFILLYIALLSTFIVSLFYFISKKLGKSMENNNE